MPWAKLDDNLPDRLSALELSIPARWLYIEGLAYCAKLTTDGQIHKPLEKLSDTDDPQNHASELVRVGLWRRESRGFSIVDYLDEQRSREVIERDRAKNRATQQRRAAHDAGDHSTCIRGRFCPDGALEPKRPSGGPNRVRNRVSNLVNNSFLSEPSQTEPSEGLSEGEGAPRSGTPDVPRAALHVDAPHIYVDNDHLGRCRLCAKSIKSGIHQQRPPRHLEALALQLAHAGIPTRLEASGDDWWDFAAQHADFRITGQVTETGTSTLAVWLTDFHTPSDEQWQAINERLSQIVGERASLDIYPEDGEYLVGAFSPDIDLTPHALDILATALRLRGGAK